MLVRFRGNVASLVILRVPSDPDGPMSDNVPNLSA